MANTGEGHRFDAVEDRSEFQAPGQLVQARRGDRQIIDGSPKQHKGVRNEKLGPSPLAPDRR